MKRTLLTLACSMAIFMNLNAATIPWDNGGDGVSWSDPLNWDGDVLPSASDDVDIDGFTVNVDVSTTVQRVNVFGSGELTIPLGVTLTIDGFIGNDEGLEVNNSATVINNGTINVSNILGGTGADGIYVRGTFMNNGSITIDAIAQHGLYVQRGNFTNGTSGTIMISNTGVMNGDGDGLYVDDSSGVLGLLTNQGMITINASSGDDSIYVNDGSTLTNMGSLIVTGEGDNGVRLDDSGIFNNMAGATFSVDGHHDDQILVDNNGAVFNNSGTINLSNADGDDAGLYVIDNGTFINMASGVVNIMTAEQYAIQIDANGNAAEIINNGTFNLTSSSNDGLRIQENGTFTNNASGVLNFVTAGDEAIQIDNPGTVNNMGTIDIDAPNDHGMEILGTFINSALVDISGALDNGITMTTSGTFMNNASGIVNTSLTTNRGIQIDANNNGSPATITNHGTINLASSSDHSFRIVESGVFTNMASGTINITSASRKGFVVETGSVVNNSGSIVVTAATEEAMDLIEGTFNNMTTGVFTATNTVDDGLEINGPSVLNNDGFLNIDGSGSDDIETIGGPIINNTSNAIFRPGSSPGDLEIRGDFDLGTSTVIFEIEGLTPTTEYDQIKSDESTHSITIGSATAMLEFGTFEPSVGDEFSIVDASGTIIGAFATVTSSNPSVSVTSGPGGDGFLVVIAEILPVEFTRFNARSTEKGAQLLWETATEINNDGFEIERSTNGSDWRNIGFVKGNGNSSKLEQYTYLDEEPTNGFNYYRLKQVDLDGKFDYSDIVSLNFSKQGRIVNIYPNPVNSMLYINAEVNEENTLTQVYNLTGELLWSKQGSVNQIPFDNYENGIYLISITSDTETTVKKIIKQ